MGKVVEEVLAEETLAKKTLSAPGLGSASATFSLSRLTASSLRRWHLLSLDAPTVAVTWFWFFGISLGLRVDGWLAASLFVAVWIIYASDRLLDARHGALASPGAPSCLSSKARLEPRHYFHHLHRRRFTLGLGIAVVLLGLLLLQITLTKLLPELGLGALLAGWLFLVHVLVHGPLPERLRERLPKELAVGFFFAAAVALPYIREAVQPWRLSIEALLFAALCTLNCLFLSRWEASEKPLHKCEATTPAAGRLTEFAQVYLAFCSLLFLCCLYCDSSHPVSPANALLPLTCGLSTAALLALHARRQHFAALTLRALADLVLLTPLLILPLLATGRWLHGPVRP